MKETVLFICSFNSVRSQMAEGLLRSRCDGKYDIFSAGIAPAGINPHAVKVMQEIGIDISCHRSKCLSTYAGVKFDYVVILCDKSRLAGARVIPEGRRVIHRGFVSPCEIGRPEEAILRDFRLLRDKIGLFLADIFDGYPPDGS
jgi:arsenate reductase